MGPRPGLVAEGLRHGVRSQRQRQSWMYSASMLTTFPKSPCRKSSSSTIRKPQPHVVAPVIRIASEAFCAFHSASASASDATLGMSLYTWMPRASALTQNSA